MNERRKLRKKYLEQDYIKIVLDAPNLCTYCGSIANELDHVPSLAAVERILIDKGIHGYDRYLKLIVPACTRCNNHLRDKPLNTIRERITEIVKVFLLG